MKKIFTSSVLSLFLAGTLAISCGKDKPLTSESNVSSTSKSGKVFVLDTADSRIEWKGFKVVKTDNTSHFGTIKFKSGELTVNEGKLESGTFTADMNSLTSVDLKDDAEQLEKLNGHLKSGDFFEVEKFPNATFEITKVTDNTTGSDYNTLLDGNLTIKGITKPVQFNANVSVNDGEVSIATEPKDIKREDFGVKFQMPVENGVIKDEVNLQISIKAQEKK
ncbi:YceI family protein [Chryseobacterium sp.]|uniref:YceI family protein n=1 Tax=Chryseobacterium sp. TaxID=1871047 RepID=UPI0011C9C9D4|nr:YceI family protein [Chryseobacterium sp.]TXF75070.1 YceI family protein [Chryseobacterium sp.]